MFLVRLLLYILLILFLSFLAYTDFKKRTLPRKIIYSLFVMGFFYLLFSVTSYPQIFVSFGLSILFFIILLVSYRLAWVGGGDVRLWPILVATLTFYGFTVFTALLFLSSITLGLWFRFRFHDKKIPLGVLVFIPAVIGYGTMLIR